MTARWPESPQRSRAAWIDLSGIAGIGAKKLERYGPALLELLGN